MFVESIAALAFVPCFVGSGVDSGYIKIEEAYESVNAGSVVQNILNTNCPLLKDRVVRFSCSEIKKGNAMSEACYVESTGGYFFITKDLLENTHVVFSRWD